MTVIRCTLAGALLASALTASPTVAASVGTRLSAAKLARMNTCLDQEKKPAAGADACAEFVHPTSLGARTRLDQDDELGPVDYQGVERGTGHWRLRAAHGAGVRF